MKRIIVDAERCAGCRLCEMVCSFHHEARFGPRLSRIKVIKEDKHGFDYPVMCHQCDPCPSIAACSTGALTMREGVVHLNEEACTGCGACVGTCAYDAVKLDEALRPLICDLCGGEPTCVEKCPTDAIIFAEAKGVFNHPEEVRRELMRRWGIAG